MTDEINGTDNLETNEKDNVEDGENLDEETSDAREDDEIQENDEIQEDEELEESDELDDDELKSEVDEKDEELQKKSNEALDATFGDLDTKNKDEVEAARNDFAETFDNIGDSVVDKEHRDGFVGTAARCIQYEYANGLQDNPDSVTQHVAKCESASLISEHKNVFCHNGRYTDDIKEYCDKTRNEAKEDFKANREIANQNKENTKSYEYQKAQINAVLDKDIENKLSFSDHLDRPDQNGPKGRTR